MGAKSERPKNRRVKLVGGGYKWTRSANSSTGSSAKSIRRAMRRKSKFMTPEQRRAIKKTIRDMLVAKNRREG